MPLGDRTALMLSNKIMNIFFWIYAMWLITSPLDRNEEVCFGLGYVPMMGWETAAQCCGGATGSAVAYIRDR